MRDQAGFPGSDWQLRRIEIRELCRNVADAIEVGRGLEHLRPRPPRDEIEAASNAVDCALRSQDWSSTVDRNGTITYYKIRLMQLLYDVCDKGHRITAAFHAVVDLVDLGTADLTVPPIKDPRGPNLDEGEGCALLVTTNERINQYLQSKSPKENPVWNRGAKSLRYRGRLCRQFDRSAPAQFAVLDAFEKAGWPDVINVPRRMSRQTIHDINKHMIRGSRVRFGFSEMTKSITWRAEG
jgi:hypothetical protein